MAPVKKVKNAAQLRIMVERSDLELFRKQHPEGMAEGFRALLKSEQRMEHAQSLVAKAQSLLPTGGLESMVLNLQSILQRIKELAVPIPLLFSSTQKEDTASRIASLADTNGIPAKDYAQYALNAWIQLVDNGWVQPSFSNNATPIPKVNENL